MTDEFFFYLIKSNYFQTIKEKLVTHRENKHKMMSNRNKRETPFYKRQSRSQTAAGSLRVFVVSLHDTRSGPQRTVV